MKIKTTTTTLFIIFLLFASSCGSKKESDIKKDESTQSQSAKLELLDNTNLPQQVDYKQIDLNNYSLEELRLLYNYVYAIHGMHFNEADLNAFFKANTTWYQNLVSDLWEEDKLPLSKSEVVLGEEEKNFLAEVDSKIKELQQNNTKQVGSYTLGNVDNIVNLFQFKDVDDNFKEKIAENNFVITTGNNLQLFHVYEENDYNQVPSFITTDLYLQAFHMYFSYILKSLEQQKFIPILSQLCLAMYKESERLANSDNTELQEMGKYNMVYYAVPYYFLTNKKLTVPTEYDQQFIEEIKKIKNEEDYPSKFLDTPIVDFPYSLFKPRGHYSRKPEMQNYFKAMMWLQTAPFCRDDNERLKQTIFSAQLLNTTKTSDNQTLMDLYKSVYEPIVFLIGLPDNLSFMDIANFMSQQGIKTMEEAMQPTNIDNVNRMLIALSKTRNQIKPKIEITCADKVNFMPQRYLIDNDVLQNLVDIKPNAKRAYPRGLDVFAALGSAPASNLLQNFYNEEAVWDQYPKEMKSLKAKFKNYDKWNSSIYNKWIQSLLALQKSDKNYPAFMQTKSWDFKNLNTSLASWAELKHDAILYGEQPMAAECGGGGPPEPVVRGYVEPNLNFWNQLKEMVSLTGDLLNKNHLMTEDLQGKTEQLANYVDFLIQVTKKELAKEVLSEEEYSTIQYMGSSIEYFTLSVLDPELYLDNWSRVEGPDKSVAVVADIYTRNIPGCNKDGILHVATGNVNNIYVVVEINNYLYLTKGATFSYYEFVQPLGTRLTDEEWQKMLEDKKAPPMEKWMNDIVIETEPKTDERVFYSSGC